MSSCHGRLLCFVSYVGAGTHEYLPVGGEYLPKYLVATVH